MTAQDQDAPPLSPLEMALNCVSFVRAAAEVQASDDPDVQIQAYVNKVGSQATHNALIASQLALVSIAGDLRTITGILEREYGPLAPEEG